MESGACTCLPGQGLRYLEHLCLVLEQMARLQQLYLQLQLQTQRPSRVSDGQVQVVRSVKRGKQGKGGTPGARMPLEQPQLLSESWLVPSCLSQEPEEEVLAPALSSLHIPDNMVQGHREELSQTKDPGKGQLCLHLHSAAYVPAQGPISRPLSCSLVGLLPACFWPQMM